LISNLIGNRWEHSAGDPLPIFNPATGNEIDRVPDSTPQETDLAVRTAAKAFAEWSRVPVMHRTALMFRFKALLDTHVEELARVITLHHGKTINEARGEVRRGIEVVDFACGAPTLLQGRTLRSVSADVDQDWFRYPCGVAAGITPFNFPVMIPLWMFPLAIVAGNTFVLKPSEQTPLGVVRLGELFLEAGFPPGVLNIVHGGRRSVDALLAHPDIATISFVGSGAIADYVYRTAASYGKRVQAAGGAKNYIIVMPDADLDIAVPAILNSAFGNAGERCLAGSVAITVGNASTARGLLKQAAESLVVGPGDRPGVDVGPLIRSEHRDRVIRHIEAGVRAGAELLTDGRPLAAGTGFFLGPTILDAVRPGLAATTEEIFGPVLSMGRTSDLPAAIEWANTTQYGNMAVIFTASGASARQFREHVESGIVGVNVGVAQPFGFFPFSGWRGSFYGDLHLQGTDGIDFYTRKKVVVTRWG
jgi:malonate-semialdehyde dehydrogenase (acetylating)/methylmalonate-semialdehyde dehydrogenase